MEESKYFMIVIGVYILLDIFKVIYTRHESRRGYYIKLIISNLIIAIFGNMLLENFINIESQSDRFTIIIVILVFLRMIYFWENFRNRHWLKLYKIEGEK